MSTGSDLTSTITSPMVRAGQLLSGAGEPAPSSLPGRPGTSSTVLAPSTSFSAGSSMQLHPGTNSSQPDINSSDHSAPSNTWSYRPPQPVGVAAADTTTIIKGRGIVVTTAPRSSSLPFSVMGHNYSKSSPTPPVISSSASGSAPSHLAAKGLAFGNAAVAGGIKLKRALAGRRKKSEDASAVLATRALDGRRERDPHRIEAIPSSSSSPAQVTSSALSPLAQSRGAKQLTHLATQVFGSAAGKWAAKSSIQASTSLPPPPPPKYSGIQQSARREPQSPPTQIKSNHQLDVIDNRSSIIPMSPGISSAVSFMRIGEEQREQERMAAQESLKEKERYERELEVERVNAAAAAEKAALKEAWRKSDSAMSHHTIRPGAQGNRASRPVSMAESLQSNHTIVPVNKRLSALITDADFGVAEEDDDSSTVSRGHEVSAGSHKVSPTSSLKVKNRRSMSLNVGPYSYTKSQPVPPISHAMAADIKQPSKSISEGVHPSTPLTPGEMPTVSRTDASGFITPTSTGMQSTDNNIRGRLAAWSATTSNQSPIERSLPGLPPPRPRNQGTSPGPSFRQTAISMTSGLAPAAGLAKRAVEKMGRAWGGMSSSSGSGYSSSSSSTAPSSFSSASISDNVLARTSSNQSNPSMHAHMYKGKHKRTPGPSGTWSIHSTGTSSSISDSDPYITPAGPVLGRRLRGPMRMYSGGGVAGGIVFAKDLRTVVRETCIHAGKPRASGDRYEDERMKLGHGRKSVSRGDLKALEERRLPALVVRCAQHLLIWGVQEEGLFRVSGRPSHVTKLRAEFDTGADFDMSECSPGDLDPHAVASVFKAYLRELPEPILTHALLPYFDAALTQESNANASLSSSPPRSGLRGPGLPSGPRIGNLPAMRKPPSLSTLAMPSFAGMRPPSKSLINAFRSLLFQLPEENRDLIRTVTELIKATAKESKETKMPLSNLLLVFCPSLNMNPPLLRVLCEAEEIWDTPRENSPVLDIKRETTVFDISPLPSSQDQEGDPNEDGDNDQFSDARDGTESEGLAYQPGRRSENTTSGSRDLAEDFEENRRKLKGSKHIPAPLYTDSGGNSPLSQAHAGAHTRSTSATGWSETTSLHDDASYISTSEGYSISSNMRLDAPSSALSSSAESLATPSNSSGQPSYAHLPINSDPYTKPQAAGSPMIADSAPMSLSSAPRPVISDPIPMDRSIQFPQSPSAESIPHSSLFEKRSTPILTLPNFSPISADPPPTPDSASSSRARRLKKPSLHLLFTKRSASSLASPSAQPSISGPYAQSPRAASDSSVSTPISAVTAPQSSTFTLPPVLDTPIECSSLQLGLGINVEPSKEQTRGSHDSKRGDVLEATVVLLTKPGETPIADQYRSPSSTVRATQPASHLRLRPTRTRLVSVSSTASSNHLGLLDDSEPEEDWTQSVLLAADVDGGWAIDRTNRG